ncbi:MAG: DUF4331 family protein [Anaerolineae bacterium]|nr:DUF4331 family protein [Gemmatimonadaceae bacterium]
MERADTRRRRGKISFIAVSLAIATGVVGSHLLASDHQQTVLTELSPRMDITDVYAFPGGDNNAATDRVTLVMVTSSPLTPAQTAAARFDPHLLYQFKIDNSAPLDGIEDLVIQVTFDSTSNNARLFNVRGPVAPPSRMDAEGTPLPRGGTATVLLRNAAQPSITARPTDQVVTVTNAAGDIRIFAGATDDPFFVDLEQFFRIIPDRKPATGPLSMLPETPTASAFRGAAPPFDVTRGAPVNFLRGINALSIAIELPESLLAPGANKTIGVWGTISR